MALLLSARPDLTVDELEVLLTGSAADLGEPGPDYDYGFGLLDAGAALHSLFDIHPLTVHVTGRGSVVSDPPGITCPGDCEKESIAGTVVTLTAVPPANGTFSGWSGDCGGSEATCTVTMDEAKDVTASFSSFPWSLFLRTGTGPNN